MNRRTSLTVMIFVLSLIGAACSSSLVETSPDDTSGPGGTEPDTTVFDGDTIDSRDPGDVVFTVFVGGGFVPIEVAMGEYPQLVVFADGRVVRPGVQPGAFPGPALPSIEVVRRDVADIAALLDRAAESGLFDDDVDFGPVLVADAPSTTVSALIDGELREVRVEALEFVDGLPADAKDARRTMMDLIAEAGGDTLPGDGEVYTPDSWLVWSIEFGGGGGVVSAGDPVVWPLGIDVFNTYPDEPGRQWCAELSGEDAVTATAAAGEAHQLSEWDVDGQSRTVVFAPRFSHQPGCPA